MYESQGDVSNGLVSYMLGKPERVLIRREMDGKVCYICLFLIFITVSSQDGPPDVREDEVCHRHYPVPPPFTVVAQGRGETAPSLTAKRERVTYLFVYLSNRMSPREYALDSEGGISY
ncbi:hypothetical protein CPC08DRAFT_708449 [Agrocybe pediades]|nr:hypothetical protein CPC08DRAFT_708449 [Agrocybe pediades]